MIGRKIDWAMMETRQKYDIVWCMRDGEDYILWIRQGSIILSTISVERP